MKCSGAQAAPNYEVRQEMYMAWNEPGGNGNKPRDPWGGGDQGPPDMDEAMRKLKQQLAGIFGGGGGGGGGTPGKGVSGSPVPDRHLVIVVVWALMGFYTVDEQERGVVLRLGKYHNTVQPGLQWNPR